MAETNPPPTKGPKLTPVDHDPFASANPNLTPVDHDPFAQSSSPYDDEIEVIDRPFQQAQTPQTAPNGAVGGLGGAGTPAAMSPVPDFVWSPPSAQAPVQAEAKPGQYQVDEFGDGIATPHNMALANTEQRRGTLFRNHDVAVKSLEDLEQQYDDLQKQKDVNPGLRGNVERIDKQLGEITRRAAVLRPVIEPSRAAMDREVKATVEESVSDVKAFTQRKGEFDVVDPAKIDAEAKRLAEKYGASDTHMYRRFYNALTGKVEAGIIEPEADKIFKEKAAPLLAEASKKMEDGFTTDDVEQAKAASRITAAKGVIEAQYGFETKSLEQEAKAAYDQVTAPWKQREVEYKQSMDLLQQRVNSGQVSQEAAQAELELANAQYGKEYQQYSAAAKKANDGIVNRMNAIGARYNDRFSREQQRIWKEAQDNVAKAAEIYAASYKGDPEQKKKLDAMYSDAWKEAISNRAQAIDKADTKAFVSDAGLLHNVTLPAMKWFGKSFVSGLGGAFKGISTTVGSDAGYLLGDEMERAFLMPEPKAKEWSDLLDVRNLSMLSGQLAGGMAPSLVAAGGVAAATGGMGAPTSVSLVASGLAGWGAETADIAGRTKDQVFAKTGDITKANEAARKSFVSQAQLLPTYAFEGLPFVGKALGGIASKGGRIAAGAGIEYVTEAFQEIPQGIAEKNIVNGREAWDDFTAGLSDPATKETLIMLAPISLLGGAGQVNSQSNDQRLQEAVKTYIGKGAVAKYVDTAAAQWIGYMREAKGDNFTSAVIASLYTSGHINEKQALKLQLTQQQAKSDAEEAGRAILNPGGAKVYTAFAAKSRDLKERAGKEESPILKKALEQRAKEIDASMVDAVNMREMDHVSVTYANGSSTILDMYEAQRMLNDPDFARQVALVGEGKDGITIEATGTEGTALMTQFLGRVEHVNDYVASVQLDPENAGITMVPVEGGPTPEQQVRQGMIDAAATTETKEDEQAVKPPTKKDELTTSSEGSVPADPPKRETGGSEVRAKREPERSVPDPVKPKKAPKDTGEAPGVQAEAEPVVTKKQKAADRRAERDEVISRASKTNADDLGIQGRVLQYFIGDNNKRKGRVNTESLIRELGLRNPATGKTGTDLKSKLPFHSKNAPTIEKLAEQLSMNEDGSQANDVQEVRTAIIDALRNHTGRSSMIDALRDLLPQNAEDKAKEKYYRDSGYDDAVAAGLENEGVDPSEVDPKDEDAFDETSDEDIQIMFGTAPAIKTTSTNANPRVQQVQQGAARGAEGEVPRAESEGAQGQAGEDPEADRLRGEVEAAQKELAAAEKSFKKKSESLFDAGAIPTRKDAEVKKAPEPGMFDAEGDTRANSASDFDKAMKPLRDKVANAEKAAKDYNAKAGDRKKAAKAQTAIPENDATLDPPNGSRTQGPTDTGAAAAEPAGGRADTGSAERPGSDRRPPLRVVDEGDIPRPRDIVNAGSYAVTPGFTLSEDQLLGINLALTAFEDNKPGFLLADGTGVGKTAQILVIAHENQKRTGKPSVIITQNKQIIAGSFADDGKALGIDDVKMFTYDDIRNGKVPDEQYGLILFDEAHNLKNDFSAKSIAASGMKADARLYATATPMDRPTSAAYFLSEITGRTEEAIADELGYFVTQELDKTTGKIVRRIETKEGVSWATVLKNMVRMRNEAIMSGQMVRREFPFFGEVTSKAAPLNNEFYDNQEEVDDYWQGRIAEAKGPSAKRNLAGQRMGELSRLTEAAKADVVYAAAKADLAAGKSVVIIAENVNNSVLKGLGDRSVTGLITTLKLRFEREGIQVASVYGTNDKSAEVKKFQSGTARVLLATPQSGGTGINLDDTKGDRPRSMHITTINYSGDVIDQMLGRVSRRNTASPAQVTVWFGENVMSDARRKVIADKKLAVLRRIQTGEDPDIAGFTDEPAAAAYRQKDPEVPATELEDMTDKELADFLDARFGAMGVAAKGQASAARFASFQQFNGAMMSAYSLRDIDAMKDAFASAATPYKVRFLKEAKASGNTHLWEWAKHLATESPLPVADPPRRRTDTGTASAPPPPGSVSNPPATPTDRLDFDITALVQLLRQYDKFPHINLRLRTAYGRMVGGDIGQVELKERLLWDQALAKRVLAHEIGHFIDLMIEEKGKGLPFGARIVGLNALKAHVGSKKALRDQAKALSREWRGDFKDKDTYRDTATELFADYMSAMFTDPQLVKDKYTMLHDAFGEMLVRKPEFATAYNLLTDWLKGNSVADEYIRQRGESLKRTNEDLLKPKDKSKDRTWGDSFKEAQVNIWQRAAGIENEKRLGSKITDKLEISGSWAVNQNAFFASDYTQNVQPLVNQIDPDPLVAVTKLDAYNQAQRTINERRAGGLWIENNPVAARELLTKVVNASPRLISKGYLNALNNAPDTALYDLAAEMFREVHDGGPLMLERITGLIDDLDLGISGESALIAFNVRGKLLNPGGLTPTSAEKVLETLKAGMTPEQWSAMEAAAKGLRDMLFETLKAAYSEGLFSKSAWEEMILPNKDNYVPYAVLDYWDGHIGAGSMKQSGTAKDVANTVLATQLKVASLNAWRQKQRQVQLLQDIYTKGGVPFEVTRALKKSSDLHAIRLANKEDDISRTIFYVNGTPHMVEFTHDPGKSLERALDSSSFYTHLERVHDMSGMMSSVMQMFTTFNLSFLLFRNVIRGYRTALGRIGVRAVAQQTFSLKEQREALRLARNYTNAAYGEVLLPEVKELIDSGALVAPRLSFGHIRNADNAKELLETGGILASQVGQFKDKPARWFGGKARVYFEKLASGYEALEKIHNMRAAGRKWDSSTASAVAMRGGIPKPGVGGHSSRAWELIMPWMRVSIQGYRSTIDTMRDPRMAKAFAARIAIFELLPRLFNVAAGVGLVQWLLSGDDDEEKEGPLSVYGEAVRRASPYKMAMDNTTPLCFRDPRTGEFHPFTEFKNGKDVPSHYESFCLRMPSSEEGKVFGTLFYNLLASSSDDLKRPGSDPLEEAFSWATNTAVPGINPMLELTANVATMLLAGKNPEDDFRSQPAANQQLFDAGWGEGRGDAIFGYIAQSTGGPGDLLEALKYTGLVDKRAFQSSKRAVADTAPSVEGLPVLSSAFSSDNYAGYREARIDGLDDEKNRAAARLLMSTDARAVYDAYTRQKGSKFDLDPIEDYRYQLGSAFVTHLWDTPSEASKQQSINKGEYKPHFYLAAIKAVKDGDDMTRDSLRTAIDQASAPLINAYHDPDPAVLQEYEMAKKLRDRLLTRASKAGVSIGQKELKASIYTDVNNLRKKEGYDGLYQALQEL